METYYVPYSGDEIAAINIKGRRVVVLSTDREILEDEFSEVDHFIEFEAEGAEERNEMIASLAGSCDIVIVANDDAEISDILSSLENQLVWVN